MAGPGFGKPLLDVLARRLPKRRPIWFMRQAGRYLPEYRKVREEAGSFLDLCYRPDLAAEVTVQPLRRFDLDAAILFADILVVPHAMGLDLRFAEGEGPILSTVRSREEVRRTRPVAETTEVAAVCETVRRVRGVLPPQVALIGFCGGPWTVASYMIEGGGSDRQRAKLAAFEDEAWFGELVERLVVESVEYLSRQIAAGAEVVQIFDSWAGDLPPALRRKVVAEPLGVMVKELRRRHPEIPVIVFARGVGLDHPMVHEATGAQAMGIEAEFSLRRADELLGGRCAVQGNLDPVALLGSDEVVMREAVAVASEVPAARHIFNLGHGIRVGTRPEALAVVIEAVRSMDGRVG